MHRCASFALTLAFSSLACGLGTPVPAGKPAAVENDGRASAAESDTQAAAEPVAPASEASTPSGRESAPQRPLDEQVAESSERFANERFSLRYPASWTTTAAANEGIALVPTVQRPSEGSEPSPGTDPGFIENLNVMIVDNVGADLDIDAIIERDIPSIAATIPNFSLLSQSKVTLAGHPAVRIEYDAAIGELQLRTFQYMLLLGSKLYTITAIGERETVDAWRWQLEAIAQSVEFTDAAGEG